jgi:hypothetical protein
MKATGENEISHSVTAQFSLLIPDRSAIHVHVDITHMDWLMFAIEMQCVMFAKLATGNEVTGFSAILSFGLMTEPGRSLLTAATLLTYW